MTLHPATLLWCWLCAALALQWLSWPWLMLLALPLSLWILLAARPRFAQLFRRSRWLLLSILILFAMATPGLALPGLAGQLGLTDSGLELAATHSLRLVLLLMLLALLLEHLGVAALVAGLYSLLAPLGNDPRRSQLALRLMLVLEYVEQGRTLQQQAGVPGWRYWLTPQPLMTATQSVAVELPQTALDAHARALNAGLMLAALLVLLLLYWLS